MDIQSVRIKTPARLHLSLLDLNGSLGRIDGGLGVALEEPNIVVEGRPSDSGDLEVVAAGDWQRVITEVCEGIFSRMPSLGRGVRLELVRHYPAHAGLGSKTQLSVAVAYLVCLLGGRFDLLEATMLARLVGRGGTSGIGYKGFFEGGFILDGGHEFGEGKEKDSFLPSSASRANPAVTLLRHPFPADWHFLLVLLEGLEGAHDAHEVDIFREHCPLPLGEVRELSHLVLMKTLPGICLPDARKFGRSLYEMQSLGFKKVEVDLQVPRIRQLINFMVANGALGAGMSSFGPVVYGLAESREGALELERACREYLGDVESTFVVTSASNTGALVTVEPGGATLPASELAAHLSGDLGANQRDNPRANPRGNSELPESPADLRGDSKCGPPGDLPQASRAG
ncbi:MAG: beta-ribofuranosylaminobenzene 5'-phosphate synthase [Promethearchaeota archaeon]